jgi:hypothetical protein
MQVPSSRLSAWRNDQLEGDGTGHKVHLLAAEDIEFKQTVYALVRDSRKAALARFLEESLRRDEAEGERRVASQQARGRVCIAKAKLRSPSLGLRA